MWKQVGPNAYKLNHWALSYDMSGNLNAKVNIKERVKLTNGDAMAGTFSIQAYDPNTGDPLGPETDGDITGTRVTVDWPGELKASPQHSPGRGPRNDGASPGGRLGGMAHLAQLSLHFNLPSVPASGAEAPMPSTSA